MKSKTEILNEIIACGFPDNEVAISYEEFFDNDNCSDNCIGVNIYPDQPAPEKFYQIFKELIASKKVEHIFVRISDIDEPADWFFSDTVYVIGSLTIKELKDIIKILSPDEIYKKWMYGKPTNVPDIKSGQNIYSIFWD